MISFTLSNLTETQNLGLLLGRSLPAGSVLLLEGDLGSGKTTLVQSIGRGLGITDAIVSPTFTLINEYPEGRIPLYHLDLYRLDAQAASQLHPELYWQGIEVTPGIVAIEWAERLSERPTDYLQVRLTAPTDTARQAELMPQGQFQLPEAVSQLQK